MLPELTVDGTYVERRLDISWIGLPPEFIRLARLFQVAGDKLMVVRLDVELLPLAHPLPQLVGPPRVLRPQAGLPESRIAHSERGIGHHEIRVEADGPLEEGDGGGKVGFLLGLPSQAVGLKGFEGRRGGLLDRRIELLHNTERFAELAA
jgi:hypothetical protein